MPPGGRFPYVVRRGTIAAAFALLLALPAPAGAQSSSPAVGRDKLAERVSAECRRAGVVDDATCWTGIGRRVIRSEVAAYEKTWVHRANELQYSLGDSVPFKDAPWIGTHNSNNTTSEPATASQTDSNQQLTLTEQLRLDMRSLEIDIHWVNGRAVACHGRGEDELHAGCTTERPARDHLAEVDAWLDANPDQVLLLYLEDHVGSAGYETAGREVAEIFAGRLYTGEPGCQKLPLTLTREAVRAAGKQVVIVSDCGSGAWAQNVFSWKGDVSDESGSPVAADACPDMDYAHRLVRKYEDSTWLSATVAGGSGGWITGRHVETMMRCGVDLIGFDQILPFDGRLEGAVWTWADEDAVPAARECVVQNADGDWQGESCQRRHLPACVTAAREWLVLADATKAKGAAGACRDAGLELGTPRTSEENAALRAAAGTDLVWLGHGAPAKKRSR